MVVKEKLIIWGASGHALVVADIVRLEGKYDIVGFLDDVNLTSHGKVFAGATILGGREQLDILGEKKIRYLILGFGESKSRLKLSALSFNKGFRLATAVHPRAIVAADVSIGDGTVIAAGAVINPGGNIGGNVIVNTGASVDHECVIADGVNIGPGAHLGGRVEVGRGSLLGIGAIVKDHIRIGSGSVVGAGSVVVHDIPDNVMVYGVPAKIIKSLSVANE